MTGVRAGDGQSRDPEFAREALHILAGNGVQFALLHNERQIAVGDFTSDVDLICAVDFSTLITSIADPFRDAGIRPILAWPYDIGSTTLFVTNSDATRGAQLDFLWDTTGRGMYGLDVARILSSVEMGVAFPRVGTLHELLYLARKRQVKEQWEECRLVLDRLSDIPEAASELDHAFVGPVRNEVRTLLDGELVSARPRLRRASGETRRILGRIRRPAGAWVEIIDSEAPDIVAEAIAYRLGSLLPHSGWGRRPRTAPMHLRWLAREVAPVRWRAGIYASWTVGAKKPTPDLQLNAGEGIDASILRLVTWLEDRLLT